MERIIAASPVPVLLARQAVATAYRRVLALTAFAAACAAALAAARAVAPEAEVQLLHALDLPLRDRRHPEARLAAAEAAAAAWAAEQGPLAGPAPVMVVPGALPELITLAVEELHADLIALGAASSPGGPLGHSVRDLIRAPPADVLVARG